MIAAPEDSKEAGVENDKQHGPLSLYVCIIVWSIAQINGSILQLNLEERAVER